MDTRLQALYTYLRLTAYNSERYKNCIDLGTDVCAGCFAVNSCTNDLLLHIDRLRVDMDAVAAAAQQAAQAAASDAVGLVGCFADLDN